MRQATAYPSSTPSWPALARLRKQGQRPIAFIAVTDSGQRRAYWEHLGFYALMLPKPEECYLASGLWVLLEANRNEATLERASHLLASNPSRFHVAWRGEKFQTVIA